MDEELELLQAQFFAAQEAKSSVRLSERNVVELVNKLQQLGLLAADLLHTTNGKEYITQERLREEIQQEIEHCGRVSMVDLAATLGVDLFYVERESQAIAASNSAVSLIHGEIITASYWDDVAEEIDETLQESGHVALAEVARRFNVGLELLVGIIQSRLGTLIHGKLEGGQLYTPAHVARVKAMLRGALRAVSVSTPTPSIWMALQPLLQGEAAPAPAPAPAPAAAIAAAEGGGSSSLYSSLMAECIAEGAIQGSARGGGSTWTPAVFARSQRESIEAFFSQNGYVSYEALRKLAVAQPRQHLQAKYPSGIALDSMFVHAMLLEQLDAAAHEAILGHSWCDASVLLPSSLTSADISKLLDLCPAVRTAEKDSSAVVLQDTCLVSQGLFNVLLEKFEVEVRTAAATAAAAATGATKAVPASSAGEVAAAAASNQLEEEDDNNGGRGRGSRGKRGNKREGAVGQLQAEGEGDGEDAAGMHSRSQLHSGKGSKGKRRRGVGGKGASSGAGDGGGGAARGGVKGGGVNELSGAAAAGGVADERLMAAAVLHMFPDMEGAEGGDEEESGGSALALALARKLRPTLLASFAAAKRAAFTAGAEDRKRRRDLLQQRLDELHASLQLHAKALDVFADDLAVQAVVEKHLLRTSAAECGDLILRSQHLESQLAEGLLTDEEQTGGASTTEPLSAPDRLAIARGLPDSSRPLAVALAEAVEGKSLEACESALQALAAEAGVRLRRLDKKGERALLHIHRKALAAQLESEEHPVAALPLAVSLFFIEVHHRALQAPGRALAAAVAHLKAGLPESSFKTLSDFHTATVEFISQQSAGSTTASLETMKRLQANLADLKNKALNGQSPKGAGQEAASKNP
eukprot:jgi/Mesen1/7654/ME000400S06852